MSHHVCVLSVQFELGSCLYNARKNNKKWNANLRLEFTYVWGVTAWPIEIISGAL